jgi:hypothetical protein
VALNTITSLSKSFPTILTNLCSRWLQLLQQFLIKIKKNVIFRRSSCILKKNCSSFGHLKTFLFLVTATILNRGLSGLLEMIYFKQVGQTLRRLTAGSGKKLSLELGGKSPVVVFETADLDSTVEGVVILNLLTVCLFLYITSLTV